MNTRSIIFATLAVVLLILGMVRIHKMQKDPVTEDQSARDLNLEQFEEPDSIREAHSDPRLFAKALEHAKRMPKRSIGTLAPAHTTSTGQDANPQRDGWVSLGPGNVGGRTRAVVINPQNPNIIYAGAASGGVWKSTDSGTTWNPVMDGLPSLVIGCLAMDPADPNTMYAGTGELYTNAPGNGIYKTIDGGATWQLLPATDGSSFSYVDAIVVSPNDSRRLYAATGFGGYDGIWRSLDAGGTWTKVFAGRSDPSGVSSAQGCYSLVIRSDKGTDYLIANCAGESSSGIYVNPDAAGGGSWTPTLQENRMGRTSLAISPSDQDVVYALSAGSLPDQSLHALFKSQDGGLTWSALVRAGGEPSLATELLSVPCIDSRSQGFYDNVIAVDPLDSNRVWAGGIELYRSDDGGATWGFADDGAHPDHHAIVFSPLYDGSTNTTMFEGSDGGVFRTNQAHGSVGACRGSSSQVAWSKSFGSYCTTQFYSGAVSADGSIYIGGTQDNGYLLGSDARGFSGWKYIAGGDGAVVAIDPRDKNTIYLRNNLPLTLLKSTDGGSSFWPILSGPLVGLIDWPILIDPTNSRRIWVASVVGLPTLSRSTDGGATWTQAAILGPHTYGPVGAVAIAPSNPNLMLASIRGTGRLHRCDSAITSTAATSWPEQVIDLHIAITSISFDPNDANTAYLTNGTFRTATSHSVYVSHDGGVSWQGLDGSGAASLPNIPLSTIVPDPLRAGVLYAGSPIGIFVTQDGGATWAQESSGLANFEIGSLSFSLAGGIPRLYAFTYGRGVWRVRPADFDSQISAASIAGKRLTVSGQNFDSGAVILIDGVAVRTTSDPSNPATSLISKKGGKKIPHGQNVIIQVRNGDGSYSNQFPFTRP